MSGKAVKKKKSPPKKRAPGRESPYTHFWIGLASCRECGATVILGDKDFDAARQHQDWHEALHGTLDVFWGDDYV